MKKEIDALQDNNTWTLVKVPDDVPVIDSKWVFKIKRDAHGEVKFKARLVARGFTQKYGENYWATYAPVVRSSTIRLLIACAVEYGLIVEQIDVKNAFVKSPLQECLYMKQPKGFVKGSGLVCKLHKSLYGLKQAGHEWNKCVNDYFVNDLKFTRLKSDPCVYIKVNNTDTIIISIYVDDIIILSKNRAIIQQFKESFNHKFSIDDIGECQKIIGIDVEQNERWIQIHQKRFIEDTLKTFNMEECNPVKTPMNPAQQLECQEDNCERCELVDPTQYRAILGKLSYLAISTRPDIVFSVSSLSRFNNVPHSNHLTAVKHVLRYLKGTMDYKIRYERKKEKLCAYSDADWANCRIDRRSYTGYITWFAGAPISWASKKQQTVALSSTEAEYMALADTAREILFIKHVMKELGFNDACCGPIKILGDNIGSLKLSQNIGCNKRTKHIDCRHHFIRELVERKEITLQYCNTNKMLADICTKALGAVKHTENQNSIMTCSGH